MILLIQENSFYVKHTQKEDEKHATEVKIYFTHWLFFLFFILLSFQEAVRKWIREMFFFLLTLFFTFSSIVYIFRHF